MDFCREGGGREKSKDTLEWSKCRPTKKSKMEILIIYSLPTVMISVTSIEMSESQQWRSLQFKMEKRKIIVIQNMSCYIRGWWIKKEMILS